jgi:hypothetical protein
MQNLYGRSDERAERLLFACREANLSAKSLAQSPHVKLKGVFQDCVSEYV